MKAYFATVLLIFALAIVALAEEDFENEPASSIRAKRWGYGGWGGGWGRGMMGGWGRRWGGGWGGMGYGMGYGMWGR
ncbi:hypothetical protein L596_017563 [Steinernema carpocapsae]|uniref:Uncharacterized protein n=1 Tax=Steinernema carpocapsae TaxID=34508 RepID=A0A4U5N2R9_STECR|nr:hypothetical protein L596_017563 [Steinernema carpocapsae]